MEIQKETIEQDPIMGTQEVTRTQQHVPSQAAVDEVEADRVGAIVWYIIGFLEVLLAVRFIFLLLGANNTGFTAMIYDITHPFVTLFQGIFASPATTGSYFDTATILAMIVYALIGWGITSLIGISRHRVVTN